ncbi:MAG TPA: glycosyltransferase [Candidatus Moranbacteria bacterium]|nr:glycosyltransferase [Candidatus Moranbacteria bacterium]
MKIGIFTNNYLPNPYGVTRSVETFRREFEKRGHEVYIFAPSWKGYEDKNPRVFRYPSIDIKIKFRFPLAIPYSWKLNKIIDKLDLDIIHAQHPNLLGTVAMKWARKLACRRGRKIPLIFTWHTLYDQYTNFVPFVPSKIASNYIIKKAVKFANLADAVIVPTDSIIPIIRKWGVKDCHPEFISGSNKEMLKQVQHDRIYVIPTGVLEEEFENADRNEIRKKYNIKDDKIVLLLVSRLTSEKNVEFIFRSMKDILKKDGVKFLVAGDGYLKPKLQDFCKKEGIEKKVIFCGEVERKEIKNYYCASDIFLYASKSETQGMIITEAMYMGLPIVAVNATGINSLILNRGNGFLVSEDEKEFQSAVEKLIEGKDLREKFGEVSARIAREKFTSSICAEKMLEVYKEAIRRYKK